MRIWTAALVMLLCAGCAPNPYAKFYNGQANARFMPGYVRTADQLRIFTTSDFDRDINELMRRGYAVIGQSAFNGGTNAGNQSNIAAQAVEIGAKVVLTSSRYTNTVSGAIPFVIPKTTTTTSSGTARVTGSGGTATVTGSGASTTTSTETVVIPYSVARSDYVAVFLAPMRTRLGITVLPLDDTVRRRIQSNFGAVVSVVVEGSPAFEAEILPGDVLLRINQERVSSSNTFSAMIAKYDGQLVEIALFRDGREIVKRVQLLSVR